MNPWKHSLPPRLSLLAVLVLTGCGDSDFLTVPPRPATPPSGDGLQKFIGLPISQPTLPARWTLTDVEGRTLKATIIGRSTDAITIVRE